MNCAEVFYNMPGIASAATSIVISQVAVATKTMRVGAGGIMLPTHAPLVVAEQFGTLATLYPHRIDLGVTSREVVRLFLEQLRFELVPFFHGLQWRFAA